MPTATTENIRVSAHARFLEDQSQPADEEYVFTYEITITNDGTAPARLVARHWVITDARGGVEEVRGPGVVGETPRLGPGEHHVYTSFSVLPTPMGSMHGTYQMVRDSGETFDAEIPTFVLRSSEAGAEQMLH